MLVAHQAEPTAVVRPDAAQVAQAECQEDTRAVLPDGEGGQAKEVKERSALKARMAEHPGRPVVLVIGSSRASMGVRPDVWEEARAAWEGQP